MLDALKEQGIDLSIRGDVAQGKLYMNMRGALMDQAGLSGDAWYSMDMAALLAQSGMDWAELMASSKNLDYGELVSATLSTLTLTDSVTAYDKVKTVADTVAGALSDQSFVKEGEDYTALLELEENGVGVTVVLMMNMDGDAVTNYVMSMHMEATQDGAAVSMDMTVGVDAQDQMTAQVNMDLAGLTTMEMNMEGSYAPGRTAPVTEPPAGAQVVDYMEMIASELEAEEAALDAIGGADGPTAIVVGQ